MFFDAFFKIIALRNVFHMANFNGWNCQNVQRFSIFSDQQSFCSPKLATAFCPSGHPSTFSTRKKWLACQNMQYIPCNRNFMFQTSQKIKIASRLASVYYARFYWMLPGCKFRVVLKSLNNSSRTRFSQAVTPVPKLCLAIFFGV